MNQHAEMEEYDEQRPPGLFARLQGWKDHLMGHDGYDDDEEDVASDGARPAPDHLHASGGSSVPLKRPTPSLRLDSVRRTHVTVRRAMKGFDDARRAADGLKDGQQQIINLEQTSVEMAERIIDFLNGATYALDGSVEKIGEQVYLFTPSTVTIDVEDKATASRTTFPDGVSASRDAV
jgi:cell division inhibitor SepF